jgi:cellulose synthase operon protein C
MLRRAAVLASLLSMSIGPAVAADRDDARASLVKGISRFYSGNARTARIDVLNALKADPDWAEAHVVQARVYLALGDGAAAEDELRRAIELGLAQGRVTHLLAHAKLTQGDAKASIALAEKVDGSPATHAYAARISARAAIALGDLSRAGRELDAAIAIAPKSSLVWSDIGRLREVAGDLAGAVGAARNANALNPHNVEALLLNGRLARQQYGLVAALPWFERVLDIDSGNLEAMTEAAATLGDVGRTQEMLVLTRRMLSIAPGNPSALYFQAVLAARAGRYELARGIVYRINGRMDGVPGMMLLQSTLELAGGGGERAIDRLRRLVDLQPHNDNARRLLGLAFARTGDPAGAVAALQPLSDRSDAASYELALAGRQFEAAGDRVRASAFLDRVSRADQGLPTPFELAMREGDPIGADVAIPNIARLLSSGNELAALGLAQRLRDANKGAPAAHVVLGDVLMAMRQPREAAEAYRAASNIRFSEPTALRFVAALQASAQPQAAADVIGLFLAQNPRSVPGLVLASDFFVASGQWSRAITVLEGLRVRLGNRDASVLAKLGWSWLNAGEPAKAAFFAGKAYALMPGNAAIANGYGRILIDTGRDRATGLDLLRKAVALAPENALFRKQLAQAPKA